MRDDNEIKTGIASQGAHFYTASGEAAYTTKAKAGHDRPVTLADARKHNLFPGVSSIIACAARPGLEAWKNKQTLLSAMTLPRGDLSEQDWMGAVMRDSQEQARKAAEIGTATHAAIEQYYGKVGVPSRSPYLLTVDAVATTVRETFGEPSWIPEHSFTSIVFGYGCKLDLISIEGDGVIVDAKGVEKIDNPKDLGYDEHAMQLAAQQVAAGYPNSRCANVFFSRSQPGVVAIREWTHDETARGWEMFRNLLRYWQHKHKYFPGAP